MPWCLMFLQLMQAKITKLRKLHTTRPLWEESHSDRWISLKNVTYINIFDYSHE